MAEVPLETQTPVQIVTDPQRVLADVKLLGEVVLGMFASDMLMPVTATFARTPLWNGLLHFTAGLSLAAMVRSPDVTNIAAGFAANGLRVTFGSVLGMFMGPPKANSPGNGQNRIADARQQTAASESTATTRVPRGYAGF